MDGYKTHPYVGLGEALL